MRSKSIAPEYQFDSLPVKGGEKIIIIYFLGNYLESSTVISIVSLGLSMFVLNFVQQKTAKLTHPHLLAPSKPLTVSILR